MVDFSKESARFEDTIKSFFVPDNTLKHLKCVVLKSPEDFNLLPNIVKDTQGRAIGGVYFIWTNEPIFHSFHNNKFPLGFDGGFIVYNGIASSNIRGRIMNHLYGTMGATWSAISWDIYDRSKDENEKLGKLKTESHRKKVYSTKKGSKKIYVDGKAVKSIEQFKSLGFTQDEIDVALRLVSNNEDVVFRNGINIFEDKHKNYEWRVYYMDNIIASYAQHVESEWRALHGQPRLCSYISGR